MTRIKQLGISRINELLNSGPRKFEDQVALPQEGEDLSGYPKSRGANHDHLRNFLVL